MNKKVIKNCIGIFILILMLVLAVFGTYNSKIQKMVEVTTHVLNNIELMPESELVSIEKSNKINSVLVIGSYNSHANYEQISDYYLEELKKEGWLFDDEYAIQDKGKDNYKELAFHKEKYVLNLYYYEDFSNFGCTYAISIKWKK